MSGENRISAPRGLKLSRKALFSVAVIFALGGLVLIYWGGNNLPTNPLISAAGSALFSLGAITLVSEFYLRSVYTYELIRLVQLSDHAWESGFDLAITENKADWEGMLSKSDSVNVIATDPEAWKIKYWPMLLASAEHRAIDIRIYLPDNARSNIVQSCASLYRISEDQYKSRIDDVVEEMSGSWTSTNRHPSSKISIYRLDQTLGFTLIQTPETVSYVLHSAAPSLSAHKLLIRFDTSSKSSVIRWAANIFGDLSARELPLYFEQRPAPKLREVEG